MPYTSGTSYQYPPLIRYDQANTNWRSACVDGLPPTSWTLTPVDLPVTQVRNVAASFYNQPFLLAGESPPSGLQQDKAVAEKQAKTYCDTHRLAFALHQLISRLPVERQSLALQLIDMTHLQQELTRGLVFLAAWRHCQPQSMPVNIREELLSQTVTQYLQAYNSENTQKVTSKIGNTWLKLLTEDAEDKNSDELLARVLDIGDRICRVMMFSYSHPEGNIKSDAQRNCYENEYNQNRFRLKFRSFSPKTVGWILNPKKKYDDETIHGCADLLIAAYAYPINNFAEKGNS
ncbi:hypothetical protein [Izhakiella australiensis]|uniref:hypothetical protein n=1 Tax=Izhakiella australiensis TaxID=1926881 RepID=UPI0011157D5E|nr:hypothetical protein [Izhakiella australiensis]